jgi:hypothetical protein
MTFDFYASLGDNCEAAFQIRRVLGRDDSSFFSWNITTPQAFNALIDNDFYDIMRPENLRPHVADLIIDGKYDYMFHSQYPHTPGVVYADYPDITAEHHKKASYLIDKLKANARSHQKTAYFYKSNRPDIKAEAYEMAQRLETLHEGADNFVLVILQPASTEEDDWGHPKLKNRYLRRLAPMDDAHDGHVFSWDKVFREFPHATPMRLAGY